MMSDDAQDPFLHDPQEFERMIEHFGELARQDHEQLTAKVERMRAVLLAAAEQFARYADYHLAKQPPDREKAATNVEWSARCRMAS